MEKLKSNFYRQRMKVYQPCQLKNQIAMVKVKSCQKMPHTYSEDHQYGTWAVKLSVNGNGSNRKNPEIMKICMN